MSQPRPVGIRVPRPYETEEEFIRGDGLAIGRLGMILIGAPKRPPGITIRFEVLLSGGEPVFRGEGRVVAHRVHSNGREGLEIRFTRLDSRSKALVEQVLDMRKTGALTPASMPPPPLARPKPESKIPANPPARIAVQPESQEEQKPEADQGGEEARDSVESTPQVKQDEGEAQHSIELGPLPSPAASQVDQDGHEPTAHAAEPSDTVAEDQVPREASPPSPAPVQTAEAEDSSEEIPEIEPEEELEVLDEDPTPFAPPVMLAEIEEGPTVHAPAPPARFQGSHQGQVDPAAALSKLRARQGAFETPPSADDLLQRLRQRAKAS